MADGTDARSSWRRQPPEFADPKSSLHTTLRGAREVMLSSLEGLSEYDVRRPMTPTGTNLLGLVKHLATSESRYFGEVFRRPFPEALRSSAGDADPDADMWAAEDESRADVTDFYRRVWHHADATIDALALDAPGVVPWWTWSPDVVLFNVLVHMVAETSRHAGHADIVRELIDGGARESAPDEARRTRHRERVEHAARVVGLPGPSPR